MNKILPILLICVIPLLSGCVTTERRIAPPPIAVWVPEHWVYFPDGSRQWLPGQWETTPDTVVIYDSWPWFGRINIGFGGHRK